MKEEKSIAIVTLNGYFNYGNRLQNYALQKFLEQQGFKVETIVFERNENHLKQKVIRFLGKIRRILFHTKNYFSELKRTKIFMEFSNKYINESDSSFNINQDLKKLGDKYDYFVLGSDQVWNPYMNKVSGVYFGNFAPKQKVISYAASFGINAIPNEFKNSYRNYLNGINAISVRENQGREIVRELVNREALVVVDPTMLISKDEWSNIASFTIDMESEYLLTYFLGGIPPEYEADIQALAIKNNLKIINLGVKQERNIYETGPAEFLGFIKNARLFCTDSFHGCVFSIIFETPFIAYERVGKNSMYSRIETLLNRYKLVDRDYRNITEEIIFEVDFNYSKKVIVEEIEKSKRFILENLEG